MYLAVWNKYQVFGLYNWFWCTNIEVQTYNSTNNKK